MMEALPMLIVFGVLILGKISSCNGRSELCARVYDEGGAPAVLRSQECSFQYVLPRSHNHSTRCQFASIRGRREYQEDRVFCDLDMQIDLLGYDDLQNLKIGLAAVFDGHGGKEASELAVQLLPLYFQLHINFLSKKEIDLSADELGMVFPLQTEGVPLGTHFGRHMNELRTMEVLKEALLLTIHDIDSTFSQVALTKHLLAGTTTTIALIISDQLLVANVGDSKAFICSKKNLFSNELNGTTTIPTLQATELTEDHHPDRDDEKSRIEAAGGFVSFSGVPRVNGILAVSRAIGDVFLKRYGVIAKPEISGWQHLNASDVFLVVASDGIFESLSSQDVCSLLQDAEALSERYRKPSKCISPSAMTESIVNMAFEKGSTDNLSTIVVPLRTS